MNEQTRIMCAVDLSRRSEGAFEYAMALAKSRRVQLELLFAVSPRNPFGWRVRERVLLSPAPSAHQHHQPVVAAESVSGGTGDRAGQGSAA
jgi:hypothetical protein